MKKSKNTWVEFALTGTGIGFPITAVCMLLIGGYNAVSGEVLVWMIASGLFGLLSGLFFQKLNLNLLAATVLHFVCCLLIGTCAGWVCGYADSFLGLLGGIIPVFVLVYVIVYLCVFFAMKREAEQINRALKGE